MEELQKIHDVSLKYDISTRALKYYEDMGLIKSTHVENYSYRCYDEAAITRLEQILILRKLDISIKDIIRIFSSSGMDVLLELLRDKVNDINKQSELLRNLKNIVLNFIDQVERYDFQNKNDIRLLYEKNISEPLSVQTALQETTPAETFMEITKKLEKSPVVSVKQFPAVQMAICYDVEGEKFSRFKEWIRVLEEKIKPMFSPYLEWYNVFNGHVAALYPLSEEQGKDCPFDTFHFPGGLYASATFLNDPYPYSMEINSGYLYKWIGESADYELYLTENDDDARYIMWRPIEALGKEIPQEEYFIPIVRKGEWQVGITKLDIPPETLLNPNLQGEKINMQSMVKSGDLSVTYNGDEIVLYQLGQEGELTTQESYCLPLRVELTAKTDSANIRASYGHSGILFNWGVIPTAMLTSDILEGGFYPIYGAGYVPPNEYMDITWILEEGFAALIVNGDVRFYKDDFPYIKRLKQGEQLDINFPLKLTTAFGAEVTVKKLTIYQKKSD